MPSPLGHALGGALAGGIAAGSVGLTRGAWWRDAAVFALIGMAPDLDFLVGQHSQHTHSIGAALIVAGLALALTRARPGIAPASLPGRLIAGAGLPPSRDASADHRNLGGGGQPRRAALPVGRLRAPRVSRGVKGRTYDRKYRWAVAAAAAYGSHILFDMLGHDTTPPLGVMAFWPFSSDFYQSPLPVFMAISRRYWLPGFLIHNLTAVAWELALLGPLVMLVWWRRVRCRSSSNSTEATS